MTRGVAFEVRNLALNENRREVTLQDLLDPARDLNDRERNLRIGHAERTVWCSLWRMMQYNEIHREEHLCLPDLFSLY
jgi:hypothetical protein